MRASALEIDGKGIIAQNNDEEESYVNLGNLILEASENFRINDDIKSLFLEEDIKANAAFRMPPPVANHLKHIFKTDLSWVVVVPGIYKEPWRMGLSTRLPCSIDNNKLEMPIIFYFNGEDGLLIHEGIHTIRSFIRSGESAFEEAIAMHGIPNPSHRLVEDNLMRSRIGIIDIARKKLEDTVGDNAMYALARLSRAEVYNICYAPSSYFKSLDCLRHRIMKEKMGI